LKNTEAPQNANKLEQSIVFAPPEAGFSKTLVHPTCQSGPISCKETTWDRFEASATKFMLYPCMYFRKGKYSSYTYEEVKNRVEYIAAGLMATDNLGKHVGVWSKNRPEWFMTALAAWRQGLTVVPFYETLGDEAMAHILEQAEIRVLFTEASKLPTILRLLKSDWIKEKKVCLHTICVWDVVSASTGKHENLIAEEDPRELSLVDMFTKYNMNESALEDFRLADVKVTRFCDLPRADVTSKAPVSPEDIAVIMYTSGTTGLPKGVMLAHASIAIMRERTDFLLEKIGFMVQDPVMSADSGWRYYSYLPLAHIFELALHFGCLTTGGSIWYSNGDIRKLTDDLQLVRPHVFAGVPRVYQKFYDKVQLKMHPDGGMLAWALRSFFAKQSVNVMAGLGRSSVLDVLLRKVPAAIGLSECRLFVSGAAPLASFLHEFLLTLVPEVKVVQGYGMTETVCHGTMSHFDGLNGGHVGGPVRTALIKLRDVPEMERVVTNNPPDGEILIGGPNVFRGYYKMPEKTEEDLIKHNDTMWVCTGDIGRINADGSISIVDRKKNIFKLAQGEYVAAERIEMAYAKAPSVNQIWVYGNSFKSCVVAVICPSMPWWYKNFNKDSKFDEKNLDKAITAFRTWSDYTNIELLKTALMADLKNFESSLKGFEKVKGVVIAAPENELLMAFYAENNLLTPSFKLKRPQLKKRYVDELKELYGDLGQPAQEGENWE